MCMNNDNKLILARILQSTLLQVWLLFYWSSLKKVSDIFNSFSQQASWTVQLNPRCCVVKSQNGHSHILKCRFVFSAAEFDTAARTRWLHCRELLINVSGMSGVCWVSPKGRFKSRAFMWGRQFCDEGSRKPPWKKLKMQLNSYFQKQRFYLQAFPSKHGFFLLLLIIFWVTRNKE